MISASDLKAITTPEEVAAEKAFVEYMVELEKDLVTYARQGYTKYSLRQYPWSVEHTRESKRLTQELTKLGYTIIPSDEICYPEIHWSTPK